MYHKITINLSNLLLSLSDALDLASPQLSQHQMRTAFISWEMGRMANIPDEQLEQLFIAALFHDVGALSPEEKINLHQNEVSDPEPHARLGSELLSQVPMFEPAARIVRFHHRTWQAWGAGIENAPVLNAQILFLADEVERSLDRQRFVLHQNEEIVSHISSQTRTSFHPEVVELFKHVSCREDFWLDLVSTRLYSLLLHEGPSRGKEISMAHLKSISGLICKMIDFRSRFTATHSTGVASSAAGLSRLLGFTEGEAELMEIAGNLHDLGKMVIPNSILTKAGPLTPPEMALMRQHTYFTYTVLMSIGGIQPIAEWAAFHHEKLDGTGYPFHLDAKRLSLGSRIMSVADIFTALTEDRPYRQGMKKDAVLKLLKEQSDRNCIDKSVVQVLDEHYEEIACTTRERQATNQGLSFMALAQANGLVEIANVS